MFDGIERRKSKLYKTNKRDLLSLFFFVFR
jgi:hypothetical protein